MTKTNKHIEWDKDGFFKFWVGTSDKDGYLKIDGLYGCAACDSEDCAVDYHQALEEFIQTQINEVGKREYERGQIFLGEEIREETVTYNDGYSRGYRAGLEKALEIASRQKIVFGDKVRYFIQKEINKNKDNDDE